MKHLYKHSTQVICLPAAPSEALSRLIMTILLLAAWGYSNAQTCLSEVIQFRETFGAGNGRVPLSNGRTNYNYNGGSTLNDGDYTLLKTSQAKPEWHNATDHTGDHNGRMMVTNASYTPGEFYRDTVYGLSSVSTYTVYFYAMNVNTVGTCSPNPILPRLQLIVESYNTDGTFTQLSSMVSDDLPQTATPTWVKISGQIYLPLDVTAVRYRIINNATGGCGNDLAIDDVTFSQCAPSILPVSGLSLRAESAASAAMLSWSTRQEAHTDKFLVEKSSDGLHWEYITTVKAAGESNTLKEYSARDNSPYTPVCYYRVTTVDLNGKLTYSNKAVIRPAVSGVQLTAYPNPFAGSLRIEIVAGENTRSSLRLFDISGKMVKTISSNLKQGSNTISVDGMDNLSSGLYFLDVTEISGEVLYRTKLLKR